jgi:hypothetical protein
MASRDLLAALWRIDELDDVATLSMALEHGLK